ncbi:flagellar hook-length control protein FliK [Alteromonas sp. ASW11-36]|uniref:Flagellar hook-length control protein FliK n=1 Tax=Alteromonas arenosi TaxID=3055817 RepID=A0ABT7SVB4_9ALTE|nr:flagellar hook-length control protein FliK [Alteromonas sp. ASW11-36]MDM7860121.1 flagellar hook-length control protein FliK [Alteromonas sp. ASW11-36]
MQHIAPLQTDLAAKPAGDVALDSEQMWLGTGSQSAGESGQAFSQVLTSEKRAQQSDASKPSQKALNDSTEQKSAQSGVTSTEATAEETEVSAAVDPKPKVVSKIEPADTTEMTEQVAISEGAKQSAGASEEVLPLPIIVKELPIDPQIDPQLIANQEEINWVDLVEQVQLLGKDSLGKAQVTENNGATTYDGTDVSNFIDELQITGEQSSLQAVEQAPVVIQLPLDIEQKIAQTESAVELVIDINKQVTEQNVDPVNIENDLYVEPLNIENDLYVGPIEALDGVIALPGVEQSDEAQNEALVTMLQSLLASDDESTETLESAQILETVAATQSDATDRAQAPVIVSPGQLTLQPQNNDKAAIDVVIKGSEEQQLRTLETLTQLINDGSNTPLSQNQQQNLIAALQAGISEYKEQLKQGREPGISLKSLVNEALVAADIPQANQGDMAIAKVTEQVAQTLVLADAVQQLRRDSDELLRHAQVRTDASSSDVAQLVEGQRNTQSQAVLDKPANILKPEGQTQFAEKIRWIVNARNSFAEIRLDPPELGSVQVKVNMAGEAAAVSFVVQSQQARDALDQALPRLRDMLNQQGIELGQSSVQQDNQQQQGEQQQGQFAEGNADDGMDEIAGEVIEQRVVNGSAGGIDFYA